MSPNGPGSAFWMTPRAPCSWTFVTLDDKTWWSPRFTARCSSLTRGMAHFVISRRHFDSRIPRKEPSLEWPPPITTATGAWIFTLCTYIYFQSEDQYRYPVPYYDSRNGPPNFLFHNQLTADGEGFFQDVTARTGMNHNNNRYSFAPAWCDFDGDGWPDLYVANDFGRNNLYRNDRGQFRDVAAEGRSR